MKAPKLRFPGFEEEWSENKLGEIAEIKDSARISNAFWVEKGIPYLRSSDLVNDELHGELFISKETYDKYSSQTGAPQKGDLLFTSGGKVGVTYHKEDESEVYVQGGAILYVRTSTSECLDGSFLNIYFSSHKMKKYMENASVGGTIKHFTLSPANAAPIIYPSIKEQQKIGSLFNLINKKIQIQQEKIDLLKEQKKGFMQKIFSQELRFKDETGQEFPDWKKGTFSELVTIIGGGTPDSQNPSFWKGEYQWFTPSEINQKYSTLSVRSITKLGLEKSSAKLLPKGTILLTSRATLGEMSILLNEGCTNQGFQSLVPNEQTTSEFIYALQPQIKKYCYKNASGSTFLEISKTIIEKMPIMIPTLKEQLKIAKFASDFDKSIQFETDKLTLLEKQKQAFMQQMFI